MAITFREMSKIRKSKPVFILLLGFFTLYLIHSELMISNTGESMNEDYRRTTDSTKTVVTPTIDGYLIQPWDIRQTITWIIYVHTSPVNIKKRAAIRHSWGNKHFLKELNAQILFVMGKVSDPKVMNEMKMESNRYGDIIQGDFIDSYRNLTFKALAALKWISIYCNKVQFVLKTDDDVVVDFVNLYDHFNNVIVPANGKDNLLLCHLWKKAKVMRNKKSKWYITKEDYGPDFYPPYCSGSAYVFSADAAKKVYDSSFNSSFFWIDDVYITGILTNMTNIQQVPINYMYSLIFANQDKQLRRDTNFTLVFYNLPKVTAMYKIWNLIDTRNRDKDKRRWTG